MFLKNDIISISTNPSPIPLITHKAKSQVDFIYELPEEYDNRYIYLNGLKIEILDAYYNTDGNGKDYKIKVSWKNYTVQNNVRWTGNIILHEQVIIQSGNTVTLDQGLSPTKSSKPQTINGTYVFADKTVFTCKSNSTITIEDGAKLILRNGSSLILENGAKIIIKGSGQLVLECGTTLESKMYSYIELHDAVSSILEEIGSAATYWSIPGTGSIVGNGKRIQFSGNTIVSNISYTTKSLEFGAIITTQGSVKIQSPQVIFTAKEVYLNSGFEVYPGSSLILDTNNFNCQ
ncbi:MAG TPA: hypothetical protein P5243_10505 [Bacteroidales bacterium]|nr:hypothetical protein [Bacteroidales bacterium]HRS19927.1 hypothetical protein [Bacteroidales bacterium]